jgi:hypothetical protein
VTDNPAATTESPADTPAAGWSDRKADAVGLLVIFTALVLAAVHFISGGLSS